MKLITYSNHNSRCCGILTKNGIVDIRAKYQGNNPPHSVKEILERGNSCLEELKKLTNITDDLLPLESVKLLAPIPRPPKLIALAGNYAEHVKESSMKKGFNLGMSESVPENSTPRPFIMPGTVVIGPDDIIPWPAYSETIDYEIELAVVIGKKIKCVEPADALKAVAGYTIVNDVSARTVTFKQGREQRPWDDFYDWLNGKWADGFLPMGPYLLTADEIDDPQNLQLTLKVNDQIRQNANTSQMIYTVPDIIATGTPAGVAMATGNFLKAGDKIQCDIEKLGTLTNTLGEKPKKFYKPLTD